MDERIAKIPIPQTRIAQIVATKIDPRPGLIIERDIKTHTITSFLGNVRVISDITQELQKITELAGEAIDEVVNKK